LGFIFVLINCNNQKKNSRSTESPSSIPKISSDTVNILLTKKENENNEKLLQECSKEFKSFLARFSFDSLSQIEKVKFPLKYSYYEDVISDEITTEFIDKREYIFFDLKKDKDAMKKDTDKFEIEIEKINNYNFLYIRKGFDNGIMETFKFVKEENGWFLTEVIDQST